jgi:phosphatidylserine/phosphatidylglycerophosphate/cardiolipin synthase-like enzyme
LLLRRYLPVGLAAHVAGELQQRFEAGTGPSALASCLEILCQDRRQRLSVEDLIDLVWTGPEAPGIVNRDTSVVVREMFQSAKESVLVAGNAVYQGHVIFKELAVRMDHNPGLRVRMFLDVQRPPNDKSHPTEVVRAFAKRFVQKEWPGVRLPDVYFDPRSLEIDPSKRASLHAKCVVVDGSRAFVSSANFTGAAQTKNVEVGVLINSPRFARRLVEHFEALTECKAVVSIPIDNSKSP